MDTPNSSALGLSKDLSVPVLLKICYLKPTNPGTVIKSLAKPSEKYENPKVFKKLSNIHFNSDLIVKVQILNGSTNRPVTLPTYSRYQSFTGNKRVWNQYLNLAVNYNQLTIDSYYQFTLYEMCDGEKTVFGQGSLQCFDPNNATLRKGIQKVPIGGATSTINPFELKLMKYENGDLPKIEWLDKLSLPLVEAERNLELLLDKPGYHLYLELPNFNLPVVYSDVCYELADIHEITKEALETRSKNNVTDKTINIVANRIDITHTFKPFDPDVKLANLSLLQQGAPLNLDPIDAKYHRLERNVNNSTLFDKELKPTPQLRDELLKILVKPSNIELTEIEKNMIWKFRYYFSKNNSTNSNVDNKINQKFLTKFLKSINWDNDYELDHTFNEIMPHYWSVDKIQIGDALELLSSYFNPFTLASTSMGDNDKSNKETRSDKVIKYVRKLRNFAVDRLRLASGDELLLYLLQLVQALKYESIIVDTEIKTIEPDALTVNANEDNDISKATKEAEKQLLEKSPLASFLIEKSVENEKLGNFFYWYVKVENEDQINSNSPNPIKIYSIILNKYIEDLKTHSRKHKLPNYNYLKRQVWFIKKLTSLVELLRTTFKKNEATPKKVQFLREYLADSSNEFLKFPHSFPLPLDPSVIICGCYPEDSAVFKSSLAPLKLTFKTVVKDSNHQMFGDRKKYGKYTLMFKIGDDLRQDQLVIQIIDLMDQLLKNENLDLKLTPYRILATSPIAGMIQFVANETLDSILVKTYPQEPTDSANGIMNYLRYHSNEAPQSDPVAASVVFSNPDAPLSPLLPTPMVQPPITSDLGVSSIVMDNYVKSCAGYCVITYLLGVGDRHLDNLLLSPNGKFWHADFGYILGRDPKPFPPLMKLPIQVIDGMGGLNHENFTVFKDYCFVTYMTLRKNSNLILNLFQLMLDANIPDIQFDPTRAVEKVQEKFCLEMTEEEAIFHFQNLINDSVNAFLPVVIDRLHSLAQYWRA